MIIDLILDRKSGTTKYVANDFYCELMQYAETWPTMCDPIINAMDAGQEQDVIAELCKYVKEQQWPEVLCNYISAVSWLEDDPDNGFEIRVKYKATDAMGKDYVERFSTWQPIPRERETDEQTLEPFANALKIALTMGWQMWRKLEMEVPEIGVTMNCEPRDAKSARELQALLEKAQREGKAIKGETAVNTIITQSLKAGAQL